jgi:hypothetical protein
MKNIVTLLLILILGVSLAQGVAFEKDAKFRTTKVHISSDKPLTTGSNTLVLDIKVKGKTPKDVKVSIKAFMPAMPGMPAMESKADAKDLDDGRYEAKVNIAMNGTWQIHIFIIPKHGKKMRVKTAINF